MGMLEMVTNSATLSHIQVLFFHPIIIHQS
jgi:hypothetical protein